MNKYIEIDFEKVSGFKKLSKHSKRLFIKIYQKHNAGQGVDYKEKWIPKKVKDEGDFLRVDFKNSEWLHYYFNGTWG